MKIDEILDFIAKNISKIYLWLVLSILFLPAGFIYGNNYFSISASCFLIVILNIIVKIIKWIIDKYHNSASYKIMFDNFYLELKDDEKNLIHELVDKGEAYRTMADFPFEGSYGIRSTIFYSVCAFPDSTSIKPITSTRLFKDDSCNYLFKLNPKYHKLWAKYLHKK